MILIRLFKIIDHDLFIRICKILLIRTSQELKIFQHINFQEKFAINLQNKQESNQRSCENFNTQDSLRKSANSLTLGLFF